MEETKGKKGFVVPKAIEPVIGERLEDWVSSLFLFEGERGTKMWKETCPGLHIDDAAYQKSAVVSCVEAGDKRTQNSRKRLRDDGYFIFTECVASWGEYGRFADFVLAIESLIQKGFPATFFLLFDEAWAVANRFYSIMKETSRNENNYDMLVWHIDPNKNQSGFSPHRDRQPENVATTFREDGTPKYSTCWIPLTKACPDNSCLYVLPKAVDPGYQKGDDHDDPRDPLQVALDTKEKYQYIRALPLVPGEAAVFTHRIIHWGSKGRKGYSVPRVALSFACAGDDFEPAYLPRGHLPFPPLRLRLALAAGQMLVYHERFNLCPAEVTKYYLIFKHEADEFHESYGKKVEREYISAVKYAMHQGKNTKGEVNSFFAAGGEEEEEEAMEAALEVLLRAEMEQELEGEGDSDDSEDWDEEAELQKLKQLDSQGILSSVPKKRAQDVTEKSAKEERQTNKKKKSE